MVYDLGLEYDERFQKEKHVIVVFWELAELMDDGRPFMVSQKYTLSLGEKANLRRDLESWRGKPFSEAELSGFDVERLVGVNCFLNLVQVVAQNGRTYTNIKGIMPLPRGIEPMKPVNTEIPKWAQERRAKNEVDKAIRDAESDKQPVVVVGDNLQAAVANAQAVARGPIRPAPAEIDLDSPPF